jgi:diguanylate cyclase (GGDEF)-like protein
MTTTFYFMLILLAALVVAVYTWAHQRGTALQLRAAQTEIETLRRELHERSIRDPLTGLFNRGYLDETIERELARAVREGTVLSICMAEIDEFKSIIDRHGRKAGDLALKSLANILTSYSRTGDVVSRYESEKALILLPGADMETTSRRAEDWRRAFEQSRLGDEEDFFSATLSMGIAVFPQHGRTSEEVLKLADEALRLSKQKGMNQINMAGLWDAGR